LDILELIWFTVVNPRSRWFESNFVQTTPASFDSTSERWRHF
jgi:hypothetical protein